MPTNDHPTRRRVLELTAGAAALGLAGCLGAPATADPSGSGGADGHDDEHHDGGHDHEPTEHESGHGHAHDEPLEGPSHAATVRMTSGDAGEHFEPHVSWIEPGGTLTFVNEGGSHTATTYHPEFDKPLLMPEDAAPFDSGLLVDGGAEFEVVLETPGVYHFYCAPHESLGMIGSVIVGEPDPHDQPAFGEVPQDLPGNAPQKLEHLNEKCNEALGHGH